MNPESCGNCRFWHHAHDMAETVGLCRRLPPQLMKTDMGPQFFYPGMQNVGWCGEWDSWPEGSLSMVKGN